MENFITKVRYESTNTQEIWKNHYSYNQHVLSQLHVSINYMYFILFEIMIPTHAPPPINLA